MLVLFVDYVKVNLHLLLLIVFNHQVNIIIILLYLDDEINNSIINSLQFSNISSFQHHTIHASIYHSLFYSENVKPIDPESTFISLFFYYIEIHSCKVGYDTNLEILSFTTFAQVLFIKVKINQPNTKLFYWIIPDKYTTRRISEVDVVRYGEYAGRFDHEVITISTTDYFESTWNMIYISAVYDTCVRRMIKRRFFP